MDKIGEKYLPIGTVVMLKNGTKRVMITGFCTSPNNNQKELWDYNGCFYPEGILASNQVCVFNHEQIDKIYHLGLKEDDEEKQFKEKLKKLVSEI